MAAAIAYRYLDKLHVLGKLKCEVEKAKAHYPPSSPPALRLSPLRMGKTSQRHSPISHSHIGTAGMRSELTFVEVVVIVDARDER
jgi:hypothetical protein